MKSKDKFNVATNLIVQVVVAVSGLIIPKLIIEFYGSTLNGMINSVRQFLSYAGLIELGVGNAAIVALYKPLSKNDINRISEILSEVRKKYNKIGMIYTLIIVLLSVFYPLTIKGQVSYSYAMLMTFVLAVNSIIDFFVVGKYKVLLIADCKYYILNIIKSMATIAMIILSVILIRYKFSLIVIKGIVILTHLLEAFFIKIYCNKRYAFLNYQCNKKIEFEQQKSTLVHQICMVITYNTDLVLMTFLLKGDSLKEISVYTVYSMVMSMIHDLVSSLYIGINASFGHLYADNRLDELQREFDSYEKRYYPFLTIMYSCTISLIVPFIQCYTYGITDANYIRVELAILFVLSGYSAQIKEAYNALVSGCGLYSETKKYAALEAIVNIILSVLLIQKLGIIGLLIGTVISHIIMSCGIIAYTSKRIFNNTLKKSIYRIVYNLCILIIIGLIEMKVLINIKDFGVWIFCGIMVTAVNGGIVILLNFVFEKILQFFENKD